MKLSIFSDLDGSLLEKSSKDHKAAKEALALIKENEVPLVFCSEKTKEETEIYRNKLNINDPFIVENGGAIFVPVKYFTFKFKNTKRSLGYFVIELNKDMKKMTKFMKDIKKKFEFSLLKDMPLAKAAKLMDISPAHAKLALKRKYSIVFKVKESDEDALLREIRKKKFNYVKIGKLYHLTGKASLKDAVKQTLSLLKRQDRGIKAMGIGDSEKDFEMLKAVNFPFLVQQKNSKFASDKFNKVKGKGPVGWNHVVKQML